MRISAPRESVSCRIEGRPLLHLSPEEAMPDSRRCSRSRSLCTGAWLATLAACLLASPGLAQMEIDEVIITSGPAYFAGGFTDFFIDPVVFGSGIDTVTLRSQSGTLNEVMVEVTPGEFACDGAIPSEPCENFPSLASISALGAITFDFVGDLGEVDSITIPLADYDPGAGQSGFPDIVFPLNGQTGVSTSATLEWSPPPGWVQAINAAVEETFTGVSADDVVFFGTPPGAPVTDTTWAPANLAESTVYSFELSFFEIIEIEDPRLSTDGDDFLYTSGFESFNETRFITVPEPSVAGLLLAGGAFLGLLGWRRRAL
jgi:hypothetical protein